MKKTVICLLLTALMLLGCTACRDGKAAVTTENPNDEGWSSIYRP